MPFDYGKGKIRYFMNYRCLLFDLDGTLVDSRADLVKSVNLAIAEMGMPALEDQLVMTFVGEGIQLLIERALEAALGRAPQQNETQEALVKYRRHYREHLLDETRPYPEVESVLEYFADLPKGVVTNKPVDFSLMVLEGLGLSGHFAAIIGGDSLPRRKPSPEPALEAARLCERDPRECLLIGDSRIDIEAGRAAGMTTCGFVAGFRGRDELVKAEADVLIERFGELRDLVGG